ncbi:MAG: hypothetical protein ACOYK9_02025 [Chlamydiia bacterium]
MQLTSEKGYNSGPMRARNELALKAFESHFQDDTRMIHFKVVAPIMENFFFALALFRKKEQRTMLEGKDLVLRLICYQNENGLFADAIHLLHHMGASWKKNVWIAATFHLILAEFERVIDKTSKELMQKSLDKLLSALEMIEMPQDLTAIVDLLLKKEVKIPAELNFETASSCVIMHRLATEETTRESLEKILATVIATKSRCYQGPFEGIKQYKGFPLKSLLEISLIGADDLKEEETITDRLWMESVLAADLAHLQGEASSIRHRHKNESTEILTRALFGENGLSACLICPHPTTFDKERSVYTITLGGMYEEDAHEIALYLNLDPSIHVRLKGSTSSVFRELEELEIITPDRKMTLSFATKGEGKFIGHISLDSKPYELEKGGMYDRKISIRTVERPLHCTLELSINWES